MRLRRIRPFTLILIALLGAGMILVIWLAGHQAREHALDEDSAQAAQHLRLSADALESFIERYRMLPAVLARDAGLRAALAGPIDPARQSQLNLKLEDVNGAATSSTLTLLDRNGEAVAASNWRLPTTNVEHNYRFRPYFRQLEGTDDGRFFGVGVTTGTPGYFLSKAVRDDRQRLIGALVVKITLDNIERDWGRGQDLVLVSDSQGVVFLASQQAWLYYELQPLAAAERAELSATRQYPEQRLRPLPVSTLRALPQGARLARVKGPSGEAAYLWQSLPLPAEGWTLHLLRIPRAGALAARNAGFIAAGAWLTLVFLALFLQQRARVARLQQRSQAELEQLVQQHTAALRTAQDGLVQAAQDATQGYGQSLEHLPQGVSVIDQQLRLVAWNRRYVELFRMPPELMRAGRPIEDILRHNARRGMLGADDPEEAVQRRLEHLRAARPYVYEREWPDGTVVEIRGNPLPAGGFVTSYADITAYRNAARDLRTLASTLEQRVAQRTSELEEAKGEAERANRSKSRFVAAAVHDLKQPLNAARMFVHAFGERARESPQQAECAALAGNAEDALSAQDAILSSLLDISRLESGAMETKVRNLRLGPLLEALGSEFGILAQAKGLKLCCVGTRAVVRSDETLLRRILQNFLSNAIRYTRQGRILFGCRRDGASLRIEVWDTGPGIPQQRHQEIFEEFRRFDDGHAAPGDHGAGLGLAIVDRSARLLGHRIGLRSQPGRGSVFSITLPLGDAANVAAVPAAAPLHDEAPALHGCRIWCVDDDPRVREASRALLQRWGCEVVLVGGEADALPLAQPGKAPDIVLLDYRLGERTGPDLYAQLCANWGAAPPVIVISAEHDAALLELVRSKGWCFLSKPVRPPALRALIKQLLIRNAA